MSNYDVGTSLSLCFRLRLITEMTSSSFLLYGLLWPCPSWPSWRSRRKPILLTCLSEDSGLCFDSLSFSLVSQMLPLGGSCLSLLETIKGNSNVSAVYSARETLRGKSELYDYFRVIAARRQDVITGCALDGFDFWPFNISLGWSSLLIILSNFSVVHFRNRGGYSFGSNLCLSRCRGLLGFFGPFVFLRYLILFSCLRLFLFLDFVIMPSSSGFLHPPLLPACPQASTSNYPLCGHPHTGNIKCTSISLI